MDARKGALGAIVALAVMHHDVWAWDDPTLIGGVIPVGLAWHAGLSVAAAGVWAWVTRVAWPVDPWGGEP
jgi:hypothetical protein